MRRLIVPLMFLALLGLSACGGADAADPPGAASGADTDTGADAGADAGGGLGSTIPTCPFTAAQVSDMLGRPLADKGTCVFGDGVASLTVTMSSEVAAATTFDYQRGQATQLYRDVKDIDKGNRGFLAVKDIEAQAMVVSTGGSYVLTLSSFQSTPDGYEQMLRKLLDALPV